MELNQIIEGIQARANDASPIGNTLKLKLDDECIFIDGTGDNNEVSGEDKEADCTVTITKENFRALVKGDLNPMTAFMMGKVKVSGDMGVAMKLQSFLG
jgi:putative sterol carrier protein